MDPDARRDPQEAGAPSSSSSHGPPLPLHLLSPAFLDKARPRSRHHSQGESSDASHGNSDAACENGQAGAGYSFQRRSTSASNDTTTTDSDPRSHQSSCASTAGGSEADHDDEDRDNADADDDDDDDSDCDSVGNPRRTRRFPAVMPQRMSVCATPGALSTADHIGGTDTAGTVHDDKPLSKAALAALVEAQAGGEPASTKHKPSSSRSHRDAHQHYNRIGSSTASTSWWQRSSSPGGPTGSTGTAARDSHPHKPTRPPRKYGSKMVGPALTHFRSKIQMAVRTALAAGVSTAIMQFLWNWAHALTWFGVTIAISGTRKSLGETLMAAYDFWKGGLLVLPWIYLLSLVRFHTVLTVLGLFVSVVFIIWFPGVSDAGKRMATIFLTVVVLNCDQNPALHFNGMVGDLFITLALANFFSVVALLLPLPLPLLALFDVRMKIKTIRHRLGSILRGYDHTFGLGEEVHYSMIEQLLEETTKALSEIKAQLPQVKWEMVLLRFKPQAYAHLVAYVETVEKQLELFKGMHLSLRRMSNNATHQVRALTLPPSAPLSPFKRVCYLSTPLSPPSAHIFLPFPPLVSLSLQEFLKYLQKPLSQVVGACVAVSDAATRQIESELVVCEFLRKHAAQRRQKHRLGQQQSREIRAEPRSSVLGGGGGGVRQHQRRRTMSRAATNQFQSRNHADDLDSLFTIVESRSEVLMKEFVKARLAILYGLKPAWDDGMGESLWHDRHSSMATATTTGTNLTSVTMTTAATMLSGSNSSNSVNDGLATGSSGINGPSAGSSEGGGADCRGREGGSTAGEAHRLTPVQEDTQHQPQQLLQQQQHERPQPPQQPPQVIRTSEGLELIRRRRESGQAVYNAFTAEYSKLGYFNVIPRHAFLLDLCNYVRTLPMLITACGADSDGDDPFSYSFNSATQKAKLPWSVWVKDKLIGWRGSYLDPALAVVAFLLRRPGVVESAAFGGAGVGGRGAGGGRSATTAKTSTASATPKTSSSSPSAFAFNSPTSSSASPSTGVRTPHHHQHHHHHHHHHSLPNHPSHKEATRRQKLISRFRQPVKVALAIALASLMMLYDVGPGTTWGVIAVCQALSSHPGSSFKQGYNRIQGTVLGGMFGIVILDWFKWDTKLGILLSLTAWVFLCSFNRMSSLYGEVAVVAAVTAPVIMIGPIAGQEGAMIRIQQTILGSLIYVFIDNIFWPVRAKLDLRRELLTSLHHFRELWGLTFSIFLQKAPDPVEAIANAQILHDTLTASFALQGKYISLAVDEPELFHKPFHASAYQKVVGSLSRVSLFMAMLIRASMTFPLEVEERDRAMLSSIQGAVQELEQATALALEEAWEAVKSMTDRKWKDEDDEEEENERVRDMTVAPMQSGGAGRREGALASPSRAGGPAGGRGSKNHNNNYYHRRKRTMAPPVLTAEAAHAYALLRLGQAYTKIQDWVDVYFEEHIKMNWAKDDLVLVSADLILSLNGMIFAVEALGQGLLAVGHAIRELVEREKGNYYRL